ncbi:MAG: energy-coupling factor transporter ATPase [Anaerolineae bacterium]|nr:energy-coupling factor transporter ATPase [Anaerolineae bacterium]
MADIVIRDLRYAYPPLTPAGDPIQVLRGVNLEVEKGTFIAIMGPTGAGKTTLCMALNGLIPHSVGGIFEGEVMVCGMNTREHPVPRLASRVGVVFQDADSQFFNTTVEDEVAFGPETLGLPPAEIEARITWALDVVGMSGLRTRSPFQLSGGQKQRVAIAAILAMRPDILVLDEPTSGLDPIGKQEVFRAIESLRQREHITIVLVEQEAEQIARFADQVAVLYEGRIVLTDVPEKVFAQVELMHELGVSVPQVAELAVRLNARHNTRSVFVRLEDAWRALSQLVPRQTCTPVCPLSRRPVGTSRPGKREAIIQVRDLWYHYTPEITALQGITLDIEEGDFVAIIGQNGSGKTTLAKHFNGLLKPSAGRVLVEGRDTRGLQVRELARSVGYVFQNPDHQIFCATTWEEVAFGPRNLGLEGRELEERVEEALVRFGLLDYASVPPAILGFGLRRKIGVASIYAMRPRIVVLDEPTAGLDRRSVLELMGTIQELNRAGHTIILITHDMRLVCEFARRTILLSEGRVLAYDETRAVFRDLEMLRAACIEPPQITQLAIKMAHPAIPPDVLTVDEFCHSIRQWTIGR